MANSKKAFKITSAKSRVRIFSLVTYLPEEKLKLCLMNHRHQIRAVAYAEHDKDTYDKDVYDDKGDLIHAKGEIKGKHIHIALYTYNACTLSAVRRWFYGWCDEEGKPINTLGRIPSDIFWAYDYLTHSDTDSVLTGKYVYDKSIVRSNNHDFFKGSPEYEWDSATMIVEQMKRGVDYETLKYRFGRDFIFNIQTYKNFIIEEECNGKFVIDKELVKNASNSELKYF